MSVKHFSRAILGLAILAGGVGACSDDPNDDDDDSPATVTITSGNNQTGAVSAALANPIVVKVVDEDGDAVSGVTVNWAVASGGGTVSAPTSTTASDGTTQVNWTLGATAGANTATATVTGLTPVTFTATGQ